MAELQGFDDALAPDVLALDARFGPLATATQRLSALPLEGLLTYLVDATPAAFLPELVAQFHVTGYEGGLVAATDAQRRALVRQAVRLHQKKGTPWAVKNALATLGVDVDLLDQSAQRTLYAALNPARVSGAWALNGLTKIRALDAVTGVPQIQHWAQFIVRVNLAAMERAELLVQMRALVDAFKPARSWPLFVFWLRVYFALALGADSSAVLQKQVAARYPWCGRVVSDQADARWALGRAGKPATLPGAFGAFAVGRLYGADVRWQLAGCRHVSRATLTSRAPVALWPRETLPFVGTLRTPVPLCLQRRQRRLDGGWAVGTPHKLGRFALAAGVRLARHPMWATNRLGSFKVYGPATELPDPQPARLSLSGRWRLGGPVSPAFKAQTTRVV